MPRTTKTSVRKMRRNGQTSADRWGNGFLLPDGLFGRSAALLSALMLVAPPALSAVADEDLARLKRLSIEELAGIEVSIASNRPQKLFETPAAVYVITAEDIRRSTATSLPELLRTVPGMHVARIDANKWSVSTRGFGDRFANKLLVMIDGRTVYTPTFSGVIWEEQDMMLEDVERIEVIRGPGAAVWGANAVNGVINVITKSASATQGGLVAAGGGGVERGFANVRYGGKFGDVGHFRVYARQFSRDAGLLPDGTRSNDHSDGVRGGFRADLGNGTDAVTVQGDIYNLRNGQRQAQISQTTFTEVVAAEAHASGGNLLARWERSLVGGGKTTLQAYFDRTEHVEPAADETRNTVDLAFRHQLAPLGRHSVVWGLGYRRTSDRHTDHFAPYIVPLNRTDNLASAFVEDEIALADDRLHVILGSKFEHNDYTGFEFQPNLRALWRFADNQSVWGAISRAVRTPSRGETDIQIDAAVTPTPSGPPTFGTPLLARRLRAPDLQSEELIAYEVGYRLQSNERLHLDATAFYNDYKHLRTIFDPQAVFLEGPTQSFALPHLVLPFATGNHMAGNTRGIEVNATLQAMDNWRLKAGLSYLKMRLHLVDGSVDSQALAAQGQSPRQQYSLTSSHDLGSHAEADLTARYVGGLPALAIDGYYTLDLRLAWKVNKDLELSLNGRNLLEKRRQEYLPTLLPVEVTAAERSVYAKLVWRF